MKNIARQIARNLLGKSIEVVDLKIAFHKDANIYGEHGTLRASHVTQGLKDQDVRFVFIGTTEPPALTPRIFEYIWEEARAQGFIPTALTGYGKVLATATNIKPAQLISEERRVAERGDVLTKVDNIAALAPTH
jgi:hypothetical protein